MNPVLHEIVIPCRRFRVDVQVGPRGGLSLMEQFALRFIAGGADRLEALQEALGLPSRVVMDLCVDLLRAGFADLDRASGRLVIPEAVRTEMGAPDKPHESWATRLTSARPLDAHECILLQDLVSGSVFPDSRDLRRGRSNKWAPVSEDVDQVVDIPKPKLMAAVAAGLRAKLTPPEEEDRRTQGERKIDQVLSRQRVTDVNARGRTAAGTSANAEAVERSSITVVLRVLPPRIEDGPPDFRVVGPADLPAAVRRRIAEGLGRLWDQGIGRAANQFFDRLPIEGEPDPAITGAEPLDPWGSLDDLDRATGDVSDLRELDDDTIAALHDRLTAYHERAAGEVSEAESYGTDMELVVGADAHRQLLFDALKEAKQQVVVVCPWLRSIENEPALRDALMDAVARAVRVHVLWGIEHRTRREDVVGVHAQALVDGLAASTNATGALFVPQDPCAVHAKILICDADWAVVSSCNFLNVGPGRRTLEVGVRVSSPKGRLDDAEWGRPGAPSWTAVDARPAAARSVLDLLRQARVLLSDFRLQRVLATDATTFGRREDPPSVEIGTPVTLPGASDLARRIWLDEWTSRAASLRKRLEALPTPVVPVYDAAHRQLLIEGAETASRRIVVASPRLDVGLLGRATADALKEARKRGVEVAVYYRDGQGAGDLREAREDLEAAGVRFQERDLHAKILVCDGWCVVSSFNFLSFEGYYDNDRRARHEVGLRVFDLAAADALVAALDGAPAA